MSTLEQVKPGAVRTPDDGGIKAWPQQARTFFAEVRNETRRVTWPTRNEVYATTVVVILTSAFFGIYLFALDAVLLKAYEWVLHTFGAA